VILKDSNLLGPGQQVPKTETAKIRQANEEKFQKMTEEQTPVKNLNLSGPDGQKVKVLSEGNGLVLGNQVGFGAGQTGQQLFNGQSQNEAGMMVGPHGSQEVVYGSEHKLYENMAKSEMMANLMNHTDGKTDKAAEKVNLEDGEGNRYINFDNTTSDSDDDKGD